MATHEDHPMKFFRPCDRRRLVPSRNRSTARRRPPARRRLNIEVLEDRRLLWATYVGGGDFLNNRYDNNPSPNPDAIWSFTNLSYSFANLLGAWNSALMTDAQKRAAVAEAMGLWTAVTPLTFFEMADPGTESPGALSGSVHDTGGQGNDYNPIGYPFLRWGHHNIDGAAGSTLAHARWPGDWGIHGDIHFDTGESFTVADFMETAAHEFGHALGMAHPLGDVLDYSTPPDGIEECPGDKPAVMDACNGTFTFTGPDGSFLYDDDVAGIRSLYGAGLGYVIDVTGALHIYGTGGNDLLTVNISGGNLLASSQIIDGPFTGSFTRALNNGQTTVTSVHVHGLFGGDILRIGDNDANIPIFGYGGFGDDFLDVQQVNRVLDRATGDIRFDGGDGLDWAALFDTGNPDPDAYAVTSTAVTRPSFGDEFRLYYGSTTEDVVLHAGVAQNTINITSTMAAGKFYLHNAGGADIVNIGSNGSLAGILGDVEINNQPALSTININSGNSTAKTVFLDGDANYSWLTGAAPGDIFWKNAETFTVHYTTGPSADSIGVVRTFRPFNLNSTGGNDHIVFGNPVQGMQGMAANLAIAATGGAPVITFNDLASATGRAINISTVDDGAYRQVDGFAPGWVKFTTATSVTLQMGSGADAVRVAGLTALIPIHMQGGGGGDALTVDDSYEGDVGPHWFNLYGDRLERTLLIHPVFNPPHSVHFANVESVTYRGASNTHRYNVHAVPVQTTIYGSDDANIGDKFTVFPRGASGAAAVAGNIAIFGRGGVDAIDVDDSDSPSGAVWSIYNPFDTPGNIQWQSFQVAGGGFISSNKDVEKTNLLGSQGADILNFSSYLNGSELRVDAGGGDDSFNMGVSTPEGSITANLAAFFRPLPFFDYKSGPGTDSFNIFNGNNPNGWLYTRSNASVFAQESVPGGYFATFASDAENVIISGGAQPNQFYVFESPAGSFTSLYGGNGRDVYRLGDDTAGADNIRGLVIVQPSAGNDTVIVNDVAETSNVAVHVDGDHIGAHPSDHDLFGPGGRLHYAGLAAEVVLQLGAGSDLVDAIPSADKTLILQGNNPTTPGGDVLQLQLGGLTNPVVGPHPVLANTTRYTFDNAASVSYSGFETVTTSTAVRVDFNNDGFIDGNDLAIWKGNFGMAGGAVAADGDADADVDGADFLAWQRRRGPVAVVAAAPAGIALAAARTSPTVSTSEASPDELASLAAAAASSASAGRSDRRNWFAAKDRALASFLTPARRRTDPSHLSSARAPGSLFAAWRLSAINAPGTQSEPAEDLAAYTAALDDALARIL
ncbi:MAG: hypothetical protein DCC67_03210 [Planctomycetota bacterium]|nr:MAG: hypothetical protein DCC67_03210 [Planctomycetota bacterium]